MASALPAFAQEVDSVRVDSLQSVRADSLEGSGVPVEGVRQTTSQRRADDSGLKQPVRFSARDSLVILFNDGQADIGTLVGNAKVEYDEATLEAHTIHILFDIDELRARGIRADTGWVGLPRFSQGQEPFMGLELAYNMRTERGRVVGARTEIEDGYIRADVTKLTEDSTIYVLNGAYTTCNCAIDETPSYSLRSHKMKVVDEEHIYTGPIQLFIFNIPTPLWLPFGYIPTKEGRRSGPLPPEYGEDQRGFYLRNWGWYQAINEYMDVQVRAGLWSKGSWQINPTFRYNRRYGFSGQVNVDYLRELSGERDDPDVSIANRASLRWLHNQTLSPTATLNANVDLTSSGYLRTVSQQYDDRVRQTVGSSVKYNKRWPASNRRLSVDLRQNQILATGEADLTLPSLSFTQGTLTPFRQDIRAPGQDERWYERLTVSYSGSLNNRFDFDPLPDDTLAARGDPDAAGIDWYEALFSPDKYERATGEAIPFDLTASHGVPISLPFNINRGIRLNLSPSLRYDEDWFIETERQIADSTGRVVDREAVPGFFALRQFNASVSANTTFYGIFPVGVGPYQGVRHTVQPRFSFTYRPDFFEDLWGYSRPLLDDQGEPVLDSDGEVRRYAIARGVGQGRQQTLSFSLGNVFETKRVRTDSTGEVQRKTLKLFNLDASTSYNFAADSMRLADIRLSGRTRVLDRLNLNASATLSPYALNEAGDRTIDRYLFSPRDLNIGRLTNLSITGDFRLGSGQSGGFGQRGGFGQQGGFGQPGSPNFQTPGFGAVGGSSFGAPNTYGTDYATNENYTDFSIPWSMNLRFTYSLSRRLTTLNRNATVNADFDFNLTPKWKVRGQTGYDFIQHEVVTTNLFLLRDFECWEMSLNWVPFGQFQSWGFDLHVKSGKLRDFLRIRQPRSDIKERFTQF